MIGDGYWATGIIIDQRDDQKWHVHADFYDDGFCEIGSTEGLVRTRYWEDDLDRMIDAFYDDVAELGIEWKDPTVYVENEDGCPVALKAAANRQAARLGWQLGYPYIEAASA